jgi:hypothetical protein
MGHFRYKKANGWKHTGDISKNFEAIDFYKVISVDGNEILSSVVISMKTTTVTDVNKWLKHSAIKKNITELKEGFGVDRGFVGKGKKIIYDKAEIHIYFPKEKFTNALKNTWGKVLKELHPEIDFNLSSLEEFIK